MLLRTEGLTKTFSGFTAVDDVNLTVEPNTIRAIIGPNGAGKTTLFNLLTGVYRPTDGKITFQGEDITDLPVFKRTKKGISRSFQVTNVFEGMTVRENIETAVGGFHHNYYNMFTPRSDIVELQESVDKLLEDFGLESRADSQASTLSYANKRHLEMAMAKASDPDLLLLDEPTAGMSTEEVEDVLQRIQSLSDTMAILLVEHNIEGVLAISDAITVLERGRIIADGTPDEIQRDEKVKEAYLGDTSHA